MVSPPSETEQMATRSGTDTDSLSTSFRSVTRGASIYVVAMGLGKVLSFLLQLLLTRGLGPNLYSVYTYGFTIAMVVVNFAGLGTNKSILKFIPQHDDDRSNQNRILGLAALTSVGGGLLVGGVLYTFSPTINSLTFEEPLLTDVLRIFAVFVVFHTVTRSIGSVFQSLERQGYKMLVTSITPRVFRILGTAIALFVGASLVGVTAAIVAASALTLGVALVLFFSRTPFRPTLGSSREETVTFYNVSLPLTFVDAGRMLYRKVDVLMLGFLLSASSGVGIYYFATLVASMLRLPLTGFNQLFPPIASRLHSNGEHEELQSLYALVTRWTFTIALLPAAGGIVYSTELLGLASGGFIAGEAVLLLFVLGELINAAVGPSNYLLMMTDNQYIALVNEWALGLFNIVLNFVFIIQFGLIGAALATVTVLSVINICRVVEVWFIEGLQPYSLKFLKPMLAFLVASGVMYGAKAFLSGIVVLICGGALGSVVFCVVLVVLGIEDEDKEFLLESVRSLGE